MNAGPGFNGVWVRRRRVGVDRQARQGGPALETEESEGLTADGFLEDSYTSFSFCACGNVIRDPAQIGARCPCGALLCTSTECTSTRCANVGCRTALCPSCRRMMFGGVLLPLARRGEAGSGVRRAGGAVERTGDFRPDLVVAVRGNGQPSVTRARSPWKAYWVPPLRSPVRSRNPYPFRVCDAGRPRGCSCSAGAEYVEQRARNFGSGARPRR